jgi:trigger factor
MKSSVEEISPVKKKLIVEIEAGEVDRRINKAYRDLGKQARIPGFRPGKIPIGILEGRFGREVMGDVTRDLVNETLPKALEENDTFPLNMPTIENDLPRKGETFRYTAVMEVRPRFELEGYKGIELDKERLSVEDADVDRQIEEIRRARGQMKPVEEDRGVREGDYAVFGYKGLENGEPVEGLDSENQMLRVGSGDFHPEFEKRLVGTRKGEATTIRVDFEDDYRDKNLAGRSVDFEIRLDDIKEMELPDLDDEFAKGLGAEDVATVEDLREEVRRELVKREEKRIDRDVKQLLMDRIAEGVEFALPESVVEQELNQAVESIRQNISRSGSSLEQSGLDEAKLREDLRPASEARVKRMFILGEVARKEGLEVTEEDVQKGFQELAAGIGQEAGIIRRYYEANNLMDPFKEKLLEEKTLNFLLDGAKVNEIDSEKMSQMKP